MTKIIDGKALALQHEEALREKIQQLKKPPTVVSILIGDDPSSEMYSKMKSKKAQELGIDFKIERFEAQPSRLPHVHKRIKQLNEDGNINGVMIQLPAPNQEELVSQIDPGKDIDGLTGKGLFMPATVRGVESILDSISVIDGTKVFAVIGAGGMVGQEMVHLLIHQGEEVIEIDQKFSGTSLEDIKDADVVISCVGKNNLVKSEHIKDGVVLIDVGLGDFDPACYAKASAYTPVKGGVGPMTIISLMENIVDTVV